MIQIGHGSGYSKIIRNGVGEHFFFYKGSIANLHGALYVRRIVVRSRIMEYVNDWYNDHKLGVWYWLVFSTWITLGIMVGLMFYAVMPG